MDVRDAQRDVRLAFLGGFAGQLVSGLLWLGSAAVHTWASPRAGLGATEGHGAVAGWVTGLVLIVFAVVGRWLVGRELPEPMRSRSVDEARRA